MKKIIIVAFLLCITNTLQAQNVSGVLGTNFSYQPISNTQHDFTFHTAFSFGSGGDGPPLINPTFEIVNDTLFVKGYYDIRGFWASFYSESLDTISYNYQLPSNITHIITSTNVITSSSNAAGWEIVENVYTHDFSLLSTNEIESKSITIFPNPAKNYFIIQNIENKIEKLNYQIVDFLGRIIKSGVASYNEQISVEELSKGNYILQIETEKGHKVTKKILKN